jgi:hypothetical protein
MTRRRVEPTSSREGNRDTLPGVGLIEDEIRGLEQSLLDFSVRSSPAELDRLLSDDFREFGSSGRVYTKDEIIRLLLADPAARPGFSEFRADFLAPGVVLATYRAAGSLRSSLWRREGDRWRLFFHQGTRALSPSDSA